MSWYASADELLRAILVLLVPGLLLGAAIGLRRWWLLCTAPALSVGTLSAWAVVLNWASVPWTLLSALGSAFLTAALCLLLRRATRRWWGELALPLGWWPVTVLGVVVAGLLSATAIKAGMTTPDMPPQTWDGVFHLNAVRHIIDSGDASSLHLGTLAAPMRTISIYPAAWHAVTALTVGDTVVVAANVMAFVIAAVLVPLGAAMLAGALVPASRVLPGLAAVASVTFVAFPSRMISYGTLWPNALAYALVPVAVALAIVICRQITEVASSESAAATMIDGTTRTDRSTSLTSAVAAFLVVAVGITAAHPNALLGLSAVLVPLVTVTVVTVMRRAYALRHWMTFVGLAAGAMLVTVLTTLLFTSKQMRSVIRYERDTYTGPLDAVREVLTDSQLSSTGFGNSAPSWPLAVLTVLGVVWTVVHRRNRWLGISLVVTVLLYVAAADPSLPFGVLAGPWYSDAVRLGGLYTLVAVPLVALGLLLVCEALLAVWRAGESRPVQAGVAVAVVAVFLVATGAARWDLRVDRIQGDYAVPDTRDWYGLVFADEVALIERLADELPEDAVILGNPFSGSALAYAISDVDVVFTHLSGAWSPDALYAGQHFSEIETDPEVCAAMNRLGVSHIYLDDLVYWPTHSAQKFYRGITASLPTEDGFELVDQSETARVYAVSRC